MSFSLFRGESLSERGNCCMMLVALDAAAGAFCWVVVVVVVGIPPLDF